MKRSEEHFTTSSQFANPNNNDKIEPNLKSSEEHFTTSSQFAIPNNTTKVEPNLKSSEEHFTTSSQLAVYKQRVHPFRRITSPSSPEIDTIEYLEPATEPTPSNNAKTHTDIVS